MESKRINTRSSTATCQFEEDIEKKKKEEVKEVKQLKEIKLKLPKKVTWTEETIDNEHMNKKKSKICCIFKKPVLHPDDSSSSSCESCDEKGKNAYERPMHYDRKKIK